MNPIRIEHLKEQSEAARAEFHAIWPLIWNRAYELDKTMSRRNRMSCEHAAWIAFRIGRGIKSEP